MDVERIPLFGPGDLVRHRRYGYRGVVVDRDATCQADEMWYHGNRTQPPRNQPWYHLLVHGSAATTYAAQTSLEPDLGDDPVEHPLVDVFFRGFADGKYERNEVPAPGWTT